MHTAQHQPLSTLIGARADGLVVGAVVLIFSAYSNRRIGVGTVIRVLQRWVVVQSSCWGAPAISARSDT